MKKKKNEEEEEEEVEWTFKNKNKNPSKLGAQPIRGGHVAYLPRHPEEYEIHTR